MFSLGSHNLLKSASLAFSLSSLPLPNFIYVFVGCGAYDNGIEAAEKTRIYRIALAQKMLELKEQGTQISILEKLAKGSEKVSRAEFDMNVAEVKYTASKENIMAQKKLLDSIEDDIKREYYKGD